MDPVTILAAMASHDKSDPDVAAGVAAGAAAFAALASGAAFIGLRKDDSELQAKYLNKDAKKGGTMTEGQAATKAKTYRGRVTNVFFAFWVVSVAAAIAATVLAFTA